MIATTVAGVVFVALGCYLRRVYQSQPQRVVARYLQGGGLVFVVLPQFFR